MKYLFLFLSIILVFGKVRALQSALGFGGEVVNMPPKILLMVILFGCALKIFHNRSDFKFNTLEKWMFAFFGCFVVCGTISCFLSDESMRLYAQIMDVVNYSSFVLAFYGTIIFFHDTPKKEVKEWLKPTILFFKILTVITAVFWVVEQSYGIGLTSHDISNRLFPPYEFIYYHGTYFVTVIAFTFLILSKERKIFIFLLCLLCLLSARDRGYLFLLLFFTLSFLFRKDSLNYKLLIPLVVVVGAIAGMISFQKIIYYTDEDSIRATFYIVAVLLAIRYFPLGSGWCTIGTWNAYRYDSPIFSDYYQFFLWAEENESVYADSGFSSIIGQTGLLGTFFYTGFLVLLFFVMVNRFSKNRNARLVVCVWVLFNIVCFFISDSMISNFSIISAFFMAALYLQTDEDKNLKEIRKVNQLENDKEGSV